MSSPTRCRFAPSPTGYLHVGSAQSALFNWLFARGTGAEFLLRIEDTDAERDKPELIDNILEMLQWLGLDWDGEPVHQSDNTAAHIEQAHRLAASGHAYWCDCTPEQVQERNKAAGGKPGYDGHCRDRALAGGAGFVLRFRTPDEGTTEFDDIVRGHVSFYNATLEDFVLSRSNGTPVFLLANVVDDHFMAITHVIRGEEHVNGTPKYLLIADALGLDYRPVFAHLPLLVNEQRKKLSKRRDDVSVADYKAAGYLPEAMRNYLSLLGWGPPDGVEVRPIDEILELFRLEDVSQSPAFFDVKKLDHINGEYIRAMSADAFVAAATPFLPADEPGAVGALRALATEVRDRVRRLDEVAPMIDFLWLAEPNVDEASWEKVITKGKSVAEVLDAVLAGLESLAPEDWVLADIDTLDASADDADTRAPRIRSVVRDAALSVGFVNAEGKPQLSKAQGPVRVAVTGRSVGPPLWESMAALGRERTLERLRTTRGRVP